MTRTRTRLGNVAVLSVAQLKTELKRRKVAVPSWAKKKGLVELLKKAIRAESGSSRLRQDPEENSSSSDGAESDIEDAPAPPASRRGSRRMPSRRSGGEAGGGGGSTQRPTDAAEDQVPMIPPAWNLPPDGHQIRAPLAKKTATATNTGTTTEDAPPAGGDAGRDAAGRTGAGEPAGTSPRDFSGLAASLSSLANQLARFQPPPNLTSQPQSQPQQQQQQLASNAGVFNLGTVLGQPAPGWNGIQGHNRNDIIPDSTNTSPDMWQTNANNINGGPGIVGGVDCTPQQSLWPGHNANASAPATMYQGTCGVASDALPQIDIISPSVRRDIITGKDINLAALLIPGYKGEQGQIRHLVQGSEVVQLKPLTDNRLNRSLTLPEYIKAFGIYKNTMCQAYPQRRVELDMYERDIVEMATRFGGLSYYEYHRLFSARAAALLANFNIKLDWSVRDTKLFTTIFSGQRASTCDVCRSVMHTTEFCPQTPGSSRVGTNSTSTNSMNRGENSRQEGTDIRGRKLIKYQGRVLCNNFNTERGCIRGDTCYYAHICTSCKKFSHGMARCPELHVAKGSSLKVDKPKNFQKQ